MPRESSIGRVCPAQHVVIGANLRIIGNRAVCIACQEEAAKRSKRKLRQSVLDAYGGACACCGETEDAFLCLDHVGGGGNAHRRELFGKNLGGGGAKMFRAVRDLGFPDTFQLLCWNCNYGVTLPGGCPHTRKQGD